MTAGRFFIGCALWAHRGWIGGLYPEGAKPERFLDLYVQRLTAVEGNTTFYAAPGEDVVARWRRVMPAGFKFLPKLPREVTHEGPLADKAQEAARFAWHLSALGGRLGPCFAQLPPYYEADRLGDLLRFVERWPDGVPPLTVELRHPSWFEEGAKERLVRGLAEHGVGRVVLDTRPVYECADDPQVSHPRRKPALPVLPQATARTCVVRFVGHPDEPRNLPYLEPWAERVHRWLDEGRDVYWFAHCPDEDRSPSILRTFQGLLEARDAPVPALPWARVGGDQLDLF